MNERREAKNVLRTIRQIPVDQIAPQLATIEWKGRFCIVADRLEYVDADGRDVEITLDDPVMAAQIERYVRSLPARIHSTQESALAFVRSQVSK